MIRDTAQEEPLGYAIFLPAGMNHIATTKKRLVYEPRLIKKLWNRAISGSSPLIFTESRKKGRGDGRLIGRGGTQEGVVPGGRGLDEAQAKTQPCTVDLMHEKHMTHLNLQWKPVIGQSTETTWQKEHQVLDSLLIQEGPMSQVRICEAQVAEVPPLEENGENVDATLGVPIFNLRQVQREEFWCFVGSSEDAQNSPRIRVMAFDPLQSDILLPLEGKNVLTDDKLRQYYKTMVTSSDDQHAPPSPQNKDPEDDSAAQSNAEPYLREVKYGDVMRGECLFVPSFWWITAMVRSEKPFGSRAALSTDIQLTRTEYLPHTSVLEVFAGTVRETLS
eukprot:CAMPEP_0117451984 /NCGR_PEP_ID=MMETSP0759-20121206/9327_1 /TAXON_ID=63605 /ORGANISM="Percolomonas cosmopolitus, Strain WS" /LENGTH=332 /DNA_ID=CAMNT_0005244677 /DNA_START=281 /DNA_END=1279 /DNA_ORIENTATION=+